MELGLAFRRYCCCILADYAHVYYNDPLKHDCAVSTCSLTEATIDLHIVRMYTYRPKITPQIKLLHRLSKQYRDPIKRSLILKGITRSLSGRSLSTVTPVETIFKPENDVKHDSDDNKVHGSDANEVSEVAKPEGPVARRPLQGAFTKLAKRRPPGMRQKNPGGKTTSAPKSRQTRRPKEANESPIEITNVDPSDGEGTIAAPLL